MSLSCRHLTRPRHLGGVLAFVIILFPAFVGAQASNAKSLGGMRRVAVVIESISAEAVAASVDSLGIRIKTELRLRELGLVVRNQTDTAQTDGYLYFNAVLVPTYDKTMWVINLSLSVEQPVVLRRNSRISVVASTWEARSRGRLVPTASLLPEISRMLTDMLEEFSNAWLSANPRR